MATTRNKNVAGVRLQEALKQRILSLYQRLPANQKKVANYFLQHPNEVAFHTTDSMAATLEVSKATIVRFAQSLGYDGFTALHDEVVDALQSHLEPANRFFVTLGKHTPDEALTLVAENEVKNINQTIHELDRRVLDEVVTIILRARRVYTMGIGISSLLAQVLAYELINVAIEAQALSSDTMRFAGHLVLVQKKDLVIGFSFPPYSRETVEAAAYAKRRGITVVAITDKLTAPITFHAAKVLVVRTKNMLYTNSISAISVVINALVTEIALKNKSAVEKVFKETSRMLHQTDEYVREAALG
jgi:DNA-binding MurR/RpiR family transcriptional regulator